MQRQENHPVIKVLATMRRASGTTALTKAEPPKVIRKCLTSKVRASPYANGVIPTVTPIEQAMDMHPFDRMLRPEDAAAFLEISTSNLEKRRKNKPDEPPYKKRGRKWIGYRLGDLVAFKAIYRKWSKPK